MNYLGVTTMHEKPVAVCTKCGKYTSRAESINDRCTERHVRKRCVGTFGSALNKGDWGLCPECNGTGCDCCQKFGVIFIRK